ncbi:MAG: hypothetical protein NT068_03210 [Candidatus Nomurabacteria bacterium]|nr:hypothetical protein [Candidatus Nomurabacteria bacterium]
MEEVVGVVEQKKPSILKTIGVTIKNPQLALRAISLSKVKRKKVLDLIEPKARLRSGLRVCDQNDVRYKTSLSCNFSNSLKRNFVIYGEKNVVYNIVPEKLTTYCFKKTKNRTVIDGSDFASELKGKKNTGIKIRKLLVKNPELVDSRFKTTGNEALIYLMFFDSKMQSKKDKWIPSMYIHDGVAYSYDINIETSLNSNCIAVIMKS